MQTARGEEDVEQGGPPVEITVDGRHVTLDDPTTTPNQILALAGLDPSAHYLVRIEGRHQHSFEGRGDERIHVHPGERFVSVSTGPTPVS
jgi:Multiubiquitin